MNVDLVATTSFGDKAGMSGFWLVHRFVHDQTAAALTTKFNVPFSTFGLINATFEEQQANLMRAGPKQRQPRNLRDWLQLHSQIHMNSYALLGQNPTTAPDLSIVDFGDQEQFYDWMYVHQQMHDFEQQQLGLT